jgi:hypothetical protein
VHLHCTSPPFLVPPCVTTGTNATPQPSQHTSLCTPYSPLASQFLAKHIPAATAPTLTQPCPPTPLPRPPGPLFLWASLSPPPLYNLPGFSGLSPDCVTGTILGVSAPGAALLANRTRTNRSRSNRFPWALLGEPTQRLCLTRPTRNPSILASLFVQHSSYNDTPLLATHSPLASCCTAPSTHPSHPQPPELTACLTPYFLPAALPAVHAALYTFCRVRTHVHAHRAVPFVAYCCTQTRWLCIQARL